MILHVPGALTVRPIGRVIGEFVTPAVVEAMLTVALYDPAVRPEQLTDIDVRPAATPLVGERVAHVWLLVPLQLSIGLPVALMPRDCEPAEPPAVHEKLIEVGDRAKVGGRKPLPFTLIAPAVLSKVSAFDPLETVKGEPVTAVPFLVTAYVPAASPPKRYCAVPECVLVKPAIVLWRPPIENSATLSAVCTPYQFASGATAEAVNVVSVRFCATLWTTNDLRTVAGAPHSEPPHTEIRRLYPNPFR